MCELIPWVPSVAQHDQDVAMLFVCRTIAHPIFQTSSILIQMVSMFRVSSMWHIYSPSWATALLCHWPSSGCDRQRIVCNFTCFLLLQRPFWMEIVFYVYISRYKQIIVNFIVVIQPLVVLFCRLKPFSTRGFTLQWGFTPPPPANMAASVSRVMLADKVLRGKYNFITCTARKARNVLWIVYYSNQWLVPVCKLLHCAA